MVAGPISPKPGRTITRMPVKPTIAAMDRFIPGRSPTSSAVSRMVISG